MAKNLYQRGIRHSSEQVMKLIDARVSDISAQGNQSISYIIENAILDGLFPRNKDARNIVINYLYSDSEENRVKKTLESLFTWNYTGVDWEAKQNNFGPLVTFFQFNAYLFHNLSNKDFLFQRFLKQFGVLVEHIEACSKTWDEPPAMVKLRSEWARTLYDTACKKANEMSLNYFLDVISDNWILLHSYSITYQCLSYIVSMAQFKETSKERNDLLEIIENISAEWELDD